MASKIDYFNQSMNEIVFEKKNKDYGAFWLRNLYRRHLLKALIITLSIFITVTCAPAIIKKMGWFEKEEILTLDTTIFVLHAPPSINPFEPPKPPPPLQDEVKRPTEKFIEMEAVDKDKLLEPPPEKKDLDKKEIAKEKLNTLDKESPLRPEDMANGNGTTGDGKIWNKVEQPPEFVGGEDAYYQFMGDHLIYPDVEKGNGIEGVTRVYFVVTQEGAIERIKILKSSGNANLDAEAVRLIKIQPNWKPGKQNGQPVKVSIFTDIEFKLR